MHPSSVTLHTLSNYMYRLDGKGERDQDREKLLIVLGFLVFINVHKLFLHSEACTIPMLNNKGFKRALG